MVLRALLLGLALTPGSAKLSDCSGNCWEAKPSEHAALVCNGYEKRGYTCVGDQCAGCDPDAVDMLCATMAPAGSGVNADTGKCEHVETCFECLQKDMQQKFSGNCQVFGKAGAKEALRDVLKDAAVKMSFDFDKVFDASAGQEAVSREAALLSCTACYDHVSGVLANSQCLTTKCADGAKTTAADVQAAVQASFKKETQCNKVVSKKFPLAKGKTDPYDSSVSSDSGTSLASSDSGSSGSFNDGSSASDTSGSADSSGSNASGSSGFYLQLWQWILLLGLFVGAAAFAVLTGGKKRKNKKKAAKPVAKPEVEAMVLPDVAPLLPPMGFPQAANAYALNSFPMAPQMAAPWAQMSAPGFMAAPQMMAVPQYQQVAPQYQQVYAAPLDFNAPVQYAAPGPYETIA